MTPFEDLIHELGRKMDLTLHPDTRQACLLHFPPKNISIQIDLDASGDQILVGTQLGAVPPGTYREQLFTHALRVNAMATTPRGILAFSEKNNTLILFQFMPLAHLNGEKLFNFVQLFIEHAMAWKEAIERAELPPLEEEFSHERMFGLTP